MRRYDDERILTLNYRPTEIIATSYLDYCTYLLRHVGYFTQRSEGERTGETKVETPWLFFRHNALGSEPA